MISHLGPGGSQRAFTTVANALAEGGFETHVITVLGHPADICRLSPAVIRHRMAPADASRRNGRLVSALERPGEGWRRAGPLRAGLRVRHFLTRVARLRARLREIRPDVVISFVTLTNLVTILATRGLPVATVVSERNDPELQRQRWWVGLLRRWLYRRSEIVTANTYGALQAMRTLAPGARVAYVPNPVSIPSSSRRASLAAPTFVSAARLVPQKGIDVLLRAAAQAFAALPGWRLAIAGDGPLRHDLERLARDLGIAGRVDWLGYVEDPFPTLRAARFFVSTSRFEGSPNAVLEAMSCGLPVIVTDASPGPVELIGGGDAGLVVPVGDVGATASAIERLATDEALRRALGETAAARAAAHRPETVMQRWREVIASAGLARAR